MTAADPRAGESAAPWCRAERVLWRRTLGGVVVLPVNGDQVGPTADGTTAEATTEPVALRGPAAGIWELLAEPMVEADLVSTLAATYGVDDDVVAADVGDALDVLLELGALCRG